MRIFYFTRRSCLFKFTFRFIICALILKFLVFLLKSSRFGSGPRPQFREPSVDRSQPQSPRTRYTTRGGDYYVLHNYFKAEKRFRSNESITYTTHGEWIYLDNLIPLLERWQGPISFSIYCPGYDFQDAFKRIQYMRECTSNYLVKDFVTFHMIFNKKHSPKMETKSIPSNPELLPVNCKDLGDEIALPQPQSQDNVATFRKTMGLKYPINIARNVARENAFTHFILSSDVELYPSSNIIPDFLEMIRVNNHSNLHKKVFPVGVFELHENVPRLPESKRQLVEYLDSGMAVVFHQFTCSECHTFPKFDEWKRLINQPSNGGTGNLNVFHVAKRTKELSFWEPIFIGTNQEPLYDERLNWEGMGDKMSQVFAMCLLDYEFHILDNAFLVHRPGIRRNYKHIPEARRVMHKQQQLMNKELIRPELLKLYGKSREDEC